MSVEDWAVLEIAIAAFGVNLFVIGWAVFAPWYRSVFGWALMTGEVALAALLDVVLYVHWTKTMVPSWLALSLYGFIAAGALMRLVALIYEQGVKRRRAS